ncbi:MAG: S41 family peptidase [Ichthyobacteriaceae bacterium]|nr:S41 family peptidase [Ichthyobacteriaceae bacterium]
MKKIFENGYAPLLLGIATAIGILLGSYLHMKSPSNRLIGLAKKNRKIDLLMNYIDHQYVEQIDKDSILDIAINDILKNLDPHSTYIPASEHEEVNENMNGSFVGIGVEFKMYRDTLLIMNVLKHGPSDEVGLKNGDRILVVDKDTLFGQNIKSDDVIAKLKGELGTKIRLSVYRPSTNESFIKHIERGNVPIKSVDVAYMINEQIGYIKISRFAASTYNEFKHELTSLRENGLTSLVIDLRDNPGGYMHIATEIADEFMFKNNMIVYTKNRSGEIEENFSTSSGDFKDGNLYVLINENSASASEVLAGALQDNDRGIIVGRRSFGKGLVQQEMDLGDGSAVRLTTARYYTPTGRSIQKPYSNGNKSYDDDYLERVKSGELVNADSIKTNETLKYTTPAGKIVYGGGGIIPDVFVAIDTTKYSSWIFEAFSYNNLNVFLTTYVDSNRKELENMSYSSFRKDFDKNNEVYKSFIKFLKKKDIYPKNKIKEKKLVKLRIKAYTARMLWGDDKMFPIWNTEDLMLNKVISVDEILLCN